MQKHQIQPVLYNITFYFKLADSVHVPAWACPAFCSNTQRSPVQNFTIDLTRMRRAHINASTTTRAFHCERFTRRDGDHTILSPIRRSLLSALLNDCDAHMVGLYLRCWGRVAGDCFFSDSWYVPYESMVFILQSTFEVSDHSTYVKPALKNYLSGKGICTYCGVTRGAKVM